MVWGVSERFEWVLRRLEGREVVVYATRGAGIEEKKALLFWLRWLADGFRARGGDRARRKHLPLAPPSPLINRRQRGAGVN